ncbi:ATP-grasp domain-containing protein [Salinispora mooreana]|uniref:ATP-grasp domain-containing protein n=1 Tax=Salinispora mooreana TaxID=999545 RepID=UPI00036F538A|nr:ATP-grasp domain-containing protein [Salinispora mooreana]
MRKRVCLISPKPPVLERAQRLGLDAVCVFTPEEFRKLPADVCRDLVSVVVSYQHAPERLVDLVAPLHAAAPFAAVFTVQEEGVLAAASLNDALGLDGVAYDTVALLTDKWRMREHLRSTDVAVRAQVGHSVADIGAFGAAVGYPIIAKPVAGSASIGIQRIASADEVAAAYEKLTDLGIERFLLEEYLDGPEISVDTLSFRGRHVVIALAEKLTGTNHVEFGHVIPAPLNADVEQQVVRVVSEFLDAVRLADGLSHTELKLTSAGPRVIEGHNRRGGDRINTMTEAVYDIDLEASGLAWAVGELEPLADRPTPDGAAAVVFFEARPGRLVRVDGVDEVKNHPAVREFHINVAVGQVVPEVRWSLDRAGYLVVTAGTAAEARSLAADLATRLVFVTEPVANGADDVERHRHLVAELDQANLVAAMTAIVPRAESFAR